WPPATCRGRWPSSRTPWAGERSTARWPGNRGVAYYDRIARQWHSVTGSRGGALKEQVLNDLVLSKLPPIAGRAVLELGAGNGYFFPPVLRHFSGQVPSRVVLTDQSPVLLGLAERSFRVPGAEYLVLDVRARFPFGDGAFA